MVFIGIDNGVTGTIGAVGDVTYFGKTPVFRHRKYTVKEQYIHRIDRTKLSLVLQALVNGGGYRILLENPMTAGKGGNKDSSARAWEATLNTLEDLGLDYETVPAKRWQKLLLPGVMGRDNLKEASLRLGKKLYPQFSYVKSGDFDGLLIAEYGKQIHY